MFTVIPVIKEKPKIIKIVKKKTVIVECKVLSKFAPSCTWFKEANAVKEDSRHTVLIEPLREVSCTYISNVSVNTNRCFSDTSFRRRKFCVGQRYSKLLANAITFGEKLTHHSSTNACNQHGSLWISDKVVS